MTPVRMKIPDFGRAEGEFYLCFNLTHAEDETDEEFCNTIKFALLKIGLK